jgi:peroxiredoxin
MMKKFFWMSALIPAMAVAQAPDFTLSGRIGHYNAPAKVYFDYMEAGGAGSTDSAVLVDGVFKFSGKLSGIATVRMAFASRGDGKEKAIYTGDVVYFYIGREKIRMESKDSLSNAVVTGSPVNDQYLAFNKAIGGSIMDLNKQANFEYNNGTEAQKKDTSFVQGVDKRFRNHVADRNAKELEFAKTHPGSYFSLVALSELSSNAASVTRVRPVFDGLNEDLRNSTFGKELEDRMEAFTKVVAGSVAPDFTQNDVNGHPVTLSSLRGKYVLVDFWASWCSPCRAENPNVVKQYQLYKDKGFQVISVSLDDKKEKWVDAIAKDGMPWVHVSDLKGWNNEAGKLYGIRAVPSNFLVDPQGKIVAVGLMGEALDKRLGEIFAN